MVQTFYNIGVGITCSNTKGTNGTKFDIRVINKEGHEEIKAFSLSESETNTVLEAFRILDVRRFGSILNKGDLRNNQREDSNNV